MTTPYNYVRWCNHSNRRRKCNREHYNDCKWSYNVLFYQHQRFQFLKDANAIQKFCFTYSMVGWCMQNTYLPVTLSISQTEGGFHRMKTFCIRKLANNCHHNFALESLQVIVTTFFQKQDMPYQYDGIAKLIFWYTQCLDQSGNYI